MNGQLAVDRVPTAIARAVIKVIHRLSTFSVEIVSYRGFTVGLCESVVSRMLTQSGPLKAFVGRLALGCESQEVMNAQATRNCKWYGLIDLFFSSESRSRLHQQVGLLVLRT